MDDATWQERVDALWERFDDHEPPAFVAAMEALVGERPAGDAIALFELAGARDSTGDEAGAAAAYREALALGLPEDQRRQAAIQLGSTLRNLGDLEGSVALLRAERERGPDGLDDAVVAFLALALADSGREREALGLALEALAGHLPRYGRSLTAYARALA